MINATALCLLADASFAVRPGVVTGNLQFSAWLTRLLLAISTKVDAPVLVKHGYRWTASRRRWIDRCLMCRSNEDPSFPWSQNLRFSGTHGTPEGQGLSEAETRGWLVWGYTGPWNITCATLRYLSKGDIYGNKAGQSAGISSLPNSLSAGSNRGLSPI